MFPIMPGVAALATALGLGTLWWYYNLTQEQQAEADAMARELARSLYDKAIDELSSAQSRRVYDLVRSRIL